MAVKVESPETISRNIKDWNIPVPSQKYKVVIHCSTYNHEKYIEDALKGFVMQKTNFPFCAIIIDDCSTDGTADIVRKYADEYPDIIKPICLGYNHMQHGLSRNPYFDCWHEATEYLAQCEGDDYWIDYNKLQKQVDFMDVNPEYSLCHTAFDMLEQTSGKIINGDDIAKENIRLHSSNTNLIEYTLDGNKYRIQPVSVVYRMSTYIEAMVKLSGYQGIFLMGDTQLWVALMSLGKVGFLPDKTSIYRLNDGSACRQPDMKKRLRFDLSCSEMRVVMADAFKQSNELKRKFQREYHNKLNLYLCYDSNYNPFVDIKYTSFLDFIKFNVLRLPLIRPILKYVYLKRYSKISR